MPAGAVTPAIAAKRLAAILSKARFDEAEPEPVKGMPRISHIACNSPFSARPPCRPSTSTRSSALAWSSACSSGDAAAAGLELVLERPRVTEQLAATAPHGRCRPRARTTDRPRAAPGAAPARSPPRPAAPCWCRRREWWFASALLFPLVIPGWSEGPDPELSSHDFWIPGSRCARPGMTIKSKSRSA